MKKQFDDPKLYEKTYFNKFWWFSFIVLAFLLFGFLAILCSLFFIQDVSVWWFAVAALWYAFLFFVALFVHLNYFHKFQVGVSKDGIFFRGYGFFYWGEIDSMALIDPRPLLWSRVLREHVILKLKDPDSFFSSKPFFLRTILLYNSHVLGMPRKSIAISEVVGERLADFLVILEAYRRASQR